jgi:hypothetical protein
VLLSIHLIKSLNNNISLGIFPGTDNGKKRKVFQEFWKYEVNTQYRVNKKKYGIFKLINPPPIHIM